MVEDELGTTDTFNDEFSDINERSEEKEIGKSESSSETVDKTVIVRRKYAKR